MKVLFLTEGGGDKGFGHLIRCIALAHALKKRPKAAEIKFIVSGSEDIKTVIGKEGIRAEVFVWTEDLEYTVSETMKADKVIIDSYAAERELYRKVYGAGRPGLLYIDDYNRIEYPGGIVVNPMVAAVKLPYVKDPAKKYLLGPEYSLIRKEFTSNAEREIRPGIGKVMVTMGGTSQKALIKDILDTVVPAISAEFHVVVPDLSCAEELDPEPGRSRERRDVKIHHGLNAAKIASVMRECDAAVSGGGQTLNELACCGTPTIGVCLADNQELNLASWEEKGFLVLAGRHTDADIAVKVKKALLGLDRSKRTEMSAIGTGSVDGKGAERVARALTELRPTEA